jgi:RNA 3'-terminal phosphate cyclase (ATP)
MPQRMVDRARSLLQALGVELSIVPERVRAACAGAGIFLAAEYENVKSGFSAIGERGKPSDVVTEEAVNALLRHFDSGAAVDAHLADQILIPLALATGPSVLSTERVTLHLETNAWVIGRFGLAKISIEPFQGGTALITAAPSSTNITNAASGHRLLQ